MNFYKIIALTLLVLFVKANLETVKKVIKDHYRYFLKHYKFDYKWDRKEDGYDFYYIKERNVDTYSEMIKVKKIDESEIDKKSNNEFWKIDYIGGLQNSCILSNEYDKIFKMEDGYYRAIVTQIYVKLTSYNNAEKQAKKINSSAKIFIDIYKRIKNAHKIKRIVGDFSIENIVYVVRRDEYFLINLKQMFEHSQYKHSKEVPVFKRHKYLTRADSPVFFLMIIYKHYDRIILVECIFQYIYFRDFKVLNSSTKEYDNYLRELKKTDEFMKQNMSTNEYIEKVCNVLNSLVSAIHAMEKNLKPQSTDYDVFQKRSQSAELQKSISKSKKEKRNKSFHYEIDNSFKKDSKYQKFSKNKIRMSDVSEDLEPVLFDESELSIKAQIKKRDLSELILLFKKLELTASILELKKIFEDLHEK